MGCFVRGGKNGMGCFVRGDKNYMGCFVRGGISMRDVLSGVSKNGMGCYVPGCFVLHSILLHAVSSGDKVFKTIGPRSAMMKWWSLSRSTLLNTPIVCLNVFFDS